MIKTGIALLIVSCLAAKSRLQASGLDTLRAMAGGGPAVQGAAGDLLGVGRDMGKMGELVMTCIQRGYMIGAVDDRMRYYATTGSDCMRQEIESGYVRGDVKERRSLDLYKLFVDDCSRQWSLAAAGNVFLPPQDCLEQKKTEFFLSQKLIDPAGGASSPSAEPKPVEPKPVEESVGQKLAEAEAYDAMLKATLAPKNGQGLYPLRPDLTGDIAHPFGRDEQIVLDVPAGLERAFEKIYWRYMGSGRSSVMADHKLERGPQGLRMTFNFYAPWQTNDLDIPLSMGLFYRLRNVLSRAGEGEPARAKALEIARWACDSHVALTWPAQPPHDLGIILTEEQCAQLLK